MTAIVLFTAEVFGVLLRVLECQGKRWLCAHDIAKVLEYSSSDSAWRVWSRHKDSLNEHSIKAKIGGVQQAVRLFDEVGLRCFCKYSQRPGAFHLLRWLDAGGLQSTCDDVIPFDAEPVKTASADRFNPQAKSEIDFVFEPHHQHKNVLAFKRPKSVCADAFELSAGIALQAQQQYCADLLKLLIDYTGRARDADEAENLLADIESSLDELLDGVLRNNYAPELNAARYELFSSYWLEGGDV